MKTLSLDDKTAREIYPTAPPAIKTILEENWGKAFFSQSLIERIRSWKDVCAETGKDQVKSLPFPSAEDADQLAANAHWRIMQTIKLFKQGQKCDYKPNNGQYKYFPWMEWKKANAGLGFSGTAAIYDGTVTNVGPRLCSLSKEHTDHITTVVCKEDYETYFNE